MAANNMQGFQYSDNNDTALLSWSETASYPQLHAQEGGTQPHESLIAATDVSHPGLSGSARAIGTDDGARLHVPEPHLVLR